MLSLTYVDIPDPKRRLPRTYSSDNRLDELECGVYSWLAYAYACFARVLYNHSLLNSSKPLLVHTICDSDNNLDMIVRPQHSSYALCSCDRLTLYAHEREIMGLRVRARVGEAPSATHLHRRSRRDFLNLAC